MAAVPAYGGWCSPRCGHLGAFLVYFVVACGLASCSAAEDDITRGVVSTGVQWVEGYVEGLVSDKPDLKGCIEAGKASLNASVTDVLKAVEDLKHHKSNATEWVAHILKALGELPLVMKKCEAVATDLLRIERDLASIKGLGDLGKKIIVDLLKFHSEILKELKTARATCKAHQYEECGRQLGEATRQILLGIQEHHEESVTVNRADTTNARDDPSPEAVSDVKWVLGFMEGFISDKPTLKNCTQASETSVRAVIKVLGDMEHAKTNVPEWVRDILKALSQLHLVKQQCAALPEDLKIMEKAVARLRGMSNLREKILVDTLKYHAKIDKELQASSAACKAQDYEECGRQLGEAARQILLGVDELEKPEQVPHHDPSPEALQDVRWLEGFMEGFISDKPDLKNCTQASETSVRAVIRIVQDVQHGKMNVSGWVRDLFQALSQLDLVKQKCAAVPQDLITVEKAIARIRGMSDLRHQIIVDVLKYHGEIDKDLQASSAACKAQDYEECGRQLGEAARLVLLGRDELRMAQAVVDPPPEAVQDVEWVEGFLEGFLSDKPDLKSCAHASQASVQAVVRIVQDVQHGQMNMSAWVQDILLALSNLDLVKQRCAAVPQDLVTVEKAIKSIKGMSNLKGHIIVDVLKYHAEISKELKASAAACKAQDYEECGRQLGEAARQVLLGIDELDAIAAWGAPRPVAAADVKWVEGFVEGLISDKPDLKDCGQASTDSVQSIVKVMRDVQHHKKNLTAWLQDIVQAVSKLQLTKQRCTALPEDIREIERAIADLQRLSDIKEKIIVDVLKFHKEIGAELKQAAADCDAKQYEDCGKEVGKAVRQILLGINQDRVVSIDDIAVIV